MKPDGGGDLAAEGRPGGKALGTLDALYESTRALGLHDSLEELLAEVLERARELIGFEHAAVMLLDEESGRLTVEHLSGYGDRADDIRNTSLASGQGLTGWAAANRESVRVGDVSQDPRYVSGLDEARSNLAVPLIVGSRVAGVINVESERLNAFTPEHEKLLTVLGTQAALGILTFQTQAALRQRIDQLTALYRISNMASQAGALGATLNSMLEIAAEILPQGEAAILLLDESRKTLRVAAGQGYQSAVRFLEIPVGQGITGRCAQTGVSQVVHDIDRMEDEEDYIPGIPGARSEVAVPLIADGMIIGVFNAESVKPHAFSDEHVQTLTVIARQAAEVIRSAQLLQETRRLAVTDALTGLFNRRHFNQQLEENVSRAARYDEPLALVFLDVDHFKSVNDRFGHHAGDRCLKALARTLRENVRDSDQIARIGGEEFAVGLPDTDLASALMVAGRIRERFDSSSWDWQGRSWPLSASFGVAACPESTTRLDNLMARADAALLKAKQEGRNRVAAAPKQG